MLTLHNCIPEKVFWFFTFWGDPAFPEEDFRSNSSRRMWMFEYAHKLLFPYCNIFSSVPLLCHIFSYTCLLSYMSFQGSLWGDTGLKKWEEGVLWLCVYSVNILLYLFLVILIIAEKLSFMIFSMQTSIVSLAGVSHKTELESLPLLSPNVDQSMAQARASNGLYALLPPLQGCIRSD